MWCNALQYVAVCCQDSLKQLLLQRLVKGSKNDVCCSLLQCVAVSCSVLQRVAVCCSLLQSVAVCCSLWHAPIICQGIQEWCVLQYVAVCYSVLQRATMCYSLLQSVAVCCILWHSVACSYTYIDIHMYMYTCTYIQQLVKRSKHDVSCNVLQCVTMRCSMLQRVATWCML